MLVFQRSGNVYAANNDGVFGPVCDSRDSLVAPGVPGVWGKEEAEVVCRFCHEGSRQKLPRGFFPLRGGGGGYPPILLRVFGQNDFTLRGEGRTPPFH